MKRARPKSKNSFMKKQAKLRSENVYTPRYEEPEEIQSSDIYSADTSEENVLEDAVEEDVLEIDVSENEIIDATPSYEEKAEEPEQIQDEIKYASIIEEFENNQGREEYIPRKKEVSKETKKKPGKVALIVLGILLVVFFLFMGVSSLFGGNTLAPIENGKVNVLLLGVDESGLRSDTIMVASYDANEAKVNLLSIPRDTKVYVVNRKVTRKINEVHAMSSKKKSGDIVGAEGMAEVVTQLTGIPINYYVEFSFSAIDRLFDILGPVEFNVPDIEGGGRGMNYDDPVQNLHIHLKPGLQQLSGNQVQQFLRYRKSNYGVGTGSDTDRVARQQEFFKAVIEQKVNIGILAKVPAIFTQLSKEIHTNIETGDITKYLRHAAKLTGESITTYTLPGTNKTISGGSYFVTSLGETKTLVNTVFGFDGEAKDNVTVSDKHAQKVLKAGNMQKKNEGNNQETPVQEEEVTPTPEVSEEPSPTPTPTNTPAPTKAPTNTPAPTKTPEETKEPEQTVEPEVAATPEPTKVPLEELDE